MSHFVSRRFVLGGASTAAIGLASLTGGCKELENLFKKIRTRPVRKNVATIDPNGPDLTNYRAAITAMKALPAGDNRNWTKQAQIHLNSCPHGNWFFLSWHRAYLFAFEEICRELSGDDTFALPYWNWQAQPSVPAPFWVPGQPLLHSPRSATASSVIAAGITDPATMEGIQSQADFQMYASLASTAPLGTGGGTGQLEYTPHNFVHGFVGGTMGGYWSPLDPVFWTHHCMIDACWVDWNIRRGNTNSNDPVWKDYEFTDFFGRDGAPINIATDTTILMPLLSYRYDDPLIGAPTNPLPPTAIQTAGEDADSRALRDFLEAGGPSTFVVSRRLPLAQRLDVAAGRPTQSALSLSAEAVGEALGRRERLILSVGIATPPAENDFFVRVFLGKPDATADTPVTDPHYAGSFAFFGDDAAAGASMADHKHMTNKRNFLIDVSPTAAALSRAGALPASASLPLTLVTVPFERSRQTRSAGFSVGPLELLVSPASSSPNEPSR